jgi:tetratricopeptide (TPR) repeat protein
MKSLVSLNLYSNDLSILPTTMGNFPNLETLNLGVNRLEELPEEMRMLVTLRGELDLSDNNFNERPNFVWHIKGLKHVIMSGNPLQVLSTSFTVHMVRADTAFGNGDYEGAIMHYTRVLDVDPKNIEAIGKRGMIYHRLNRTDDAIEDLTRAIDIQFEDPSLFYNRGMLYIQLSKPKKALFDFMQALDRNPEFKSAMLGQAEAYNMIGQFDTAIQKCQQALGDVTLFEDWKTSETVTTCLATCGYAYFRRGQPPKALAMFDNLLERGYDNPRKILLYRGMCFRDMDQHKDAIEAFTEIISFYDENPQKLIDGDGEFVQPKEAQESYRMALLNRSATYGSMNKEKLATKDYERVYQREPTAEILKLVEIERQRKAERMKKKKDDMARKAAAQNRRIEEQKAMMQKRQNNNTSKNHRNSDNDHYKYQHKK